jgi:20S proteasome alpha/beta subunit
MEAVKLGSATVGLKNKTHAVLIALKRASSELSAHQKKIIPIDTHIGITVAGLTADARILRYKDIVIILKFQFCWKGFYVWTNCIEDCLLLRVCMA